MITYKINCRFKFKKSVLFSELVLSVEIYNRYHMWSCNGFINLLIVEMVFKISDIKLKVKMLCRLIRDDHKQCFESMKNFFFIQLSNLFLNILHESNRLRWKCANFFNFLYRGALLHRKLSLNWNKTSVKKSVKFFSFSYFSQNII